MGQYFRIVNLDKKEWIEPSWKIWELCANNEVRMLGYLLATNNPDGTSVTKWFDDPEDAKKEYGKDFKILSYDEDYKQGYGEIKSEFFGRWCGDRIAIVGDYAGESENYDLDGNPGFWEIEEYTEITDDVAKEFNQFIEIGDLKVGTRKNLSPDAIIAGGKFQIDPKLVKKWTSEKLRSGFYRVEKKGCAQIYFNGIQEGYDCWDLYINDKLAASIPKSDASFSDLIK